MRIVKFFVCLVITAGLVYALDTKFGAIPSLGKLLSPSHGLWKNAEPVETDFNLEIPVSKLQDQVEVYLDERLVPHIFAKNDADVSFVQGYLHAKFRLWQMEFQIYSASGRLCEIFGEKVGNVSVLDVRDRYFRRLGMTYAAERTLKLLETDAAIKTSLDNYTAGVNYYISQLKGPDLPIEYKILDYAPEPWTNLKTALLLKYMSYDLSNDPDDFAFTNLRDHLGFEMFEKAFPIMPDSVESISPRGTKYQASIPLPVPPAGVREVYLNPSADSVAGGFALDLGEKNPDIGSNNWVVGGQKTLSGRPILCNDPHLSLNLPSLWYETQVHTPEYNCYGVSFPGAPGIIIGFNDSIAWGVTNSSRDVMDFYEIRFRDSTMNEYLYNGEWVKTAWRNEVIRLRNKADFVDKVPITVFGPVMFDRNYGNDIKNGKAYAVRWTAHDPGMEMKTFFQLMRARNYDQYLEAISHFSCPGQNFIFASKSNDIAWWQQANFPAKWRRQGDFVMPGWDSSYEWQAFIPKQDNVHMVNPERGFVSSANQLPADTAYPYYLGGLHDLYRGIMVNRLLRQMEAITVVDMQQMQNNNYNVLAETVRPVFLNHVQKDNLSAAAALMLDKFEGWNLKSDKDEEGPTVFFEWWREFSKMVWNDNIRRPDSLPVPFPQAGTLAEAILRDTNFVFIDNIQTPEVETLSHVVTRALNEAAQILQKAPLGWAAYKATGIRHLLGASLPAFSRLNLPIGGGTHIINAATGNHGPSWRVVVHLTEDTEAFGIYPGGQSGNPGSRFYDQFIDMWARGEYNKLWIMAPTEADRKKASWKMKFVPA